MAGSSLSVDNFDSQIDANQEFTLHSCDATRKVSNFQSAGGDHPCVACVHKLSGINVSYTACKRSAGILHMPERMHSVICLCQ